jgi:hypothetical protein
MILWQILFVALLAGAFYWVNWKVEYSMTSKEIFGLPVPQLIVDVFLGGVFILWFLQVIGVGR